MISPYLNYRFTKDHRNIVSMRIYIKFYVNHPEVLNNASIKIVSV